MDKLDQMLGYCGLYCGNCLFYQNTMKGTGTDLGDGVIHECRGCNSDQTTPWCTECQIKKSCREKGIRTCIQCDDFPCGVLTAFMSDTEYSYHKDVPDMMRRLNEIGLGAWAKEMEDAYTCPICGETFTYFDMECPRCSR